MDANLNTFAPAVDSKITSEFEVPSFPKGSSIVVVGAGAFGGWTALHLLRSGYKVTLVDAWGAGNSRASSGDETRVIRSTYGKNELYFRLNLRALELWKETQEQFPSQIFFNTGVLWLCYDAHNPIVDDSLPFATKYGVPYEKLERDEILKRYPHIFAGDLSHAWLDPFGGYLKAREACDEVKKLFIREGGSYIQEYAYPETITSQRLHGIRAGNQRLTADAFLFACGSWLPKVFPFLQNAITCTRQEVYYFGSPAEVSKAFDDLPVWIDLDGTDNYYGIPGNAARGFKIGVDRRGRVFNPSEDDRLVDADVLQHARAFLGKRFPALKSAPLIESRICPYESTSSGNFLFDVHPEASNVFLLGGGSGHGFKHGPALGELAANCIAGKARVPSLFKLHI